MTSPSNIEDIKAKSQVTKVKLAPLQVDYSYQRDTSEDLVDKVANEWDTIASELVLISDRGTRPPDAEVRGGQFIVNGQHRCKAAQKRGMEEIDARIIYLQDEPDPGGIEAGLRLKTNVRLADRSLERFKAQVRAKDERSLKIVALLQEFNTEINSQPQSDVGINAVSTVEALYDIDNGALLRDTLALVRDVWGNVGGKFTQSSLLKGLAWFIEKHAEESDRNRLVEKLRNLGIAPLRSRANTISLTMSGALWVNYYRAIVDLYNEGLREKNRLNWMLRGSTRLAPASQRGKNID